MTIMSMRARNVIHNIQVNKENDDLSSPTEEKLIQVVDTVLSQIRGDQTPYEICVSIVDEAEGQQLNRQYRNKDKPTNVLAFPCDMPDDTFAHVLGDVIICAPIVNNEAHAHQQSVESHWTHILIHGTLHLLGYDHQTAAEATIMEALEVKFLAHWGFANPYEELSTTEAIPHE